MQALPHTGKVAENYLEREGATELEWTCKY